MERKKRLSSEERRYQICDIARGLFVKKGLNNITMEDIRKEAGISVGGLYHHYRDIYDVLKDTIMSAGDKKNDIFLQVKNRHPEMDADELVKETFVAMLFDKSEHSILYVFLLMAMADNDELHRMYMERKIKAKKEYLDFLESIGARHLYCLANDDFLDFFNITKIGIYYLEDELALEETRKIYLTFVDRYIEDNNLDEVDLC